MPKYVQIDGVYWKSKEAVYCECTRLRLNPEETHVFFGTWATDGKHVYWGTHILRRANASTFAGLNALYAKDDSNCFACPPGIGDIKTISSADPATFEVLDSGEEDIGCLGGTNLPGGYACDSNNVFFNGNILKTADRKTFVSLGSCYGRDNKHIYFERRRLPKANPKRWRRLKGYYSCDDFNLYWQNKKVPSGQPPYQLEIIEAGGHALSYDGEQFFIEGNPCEIQDAIHFCERQANGVGEFARLLQIGKWQEVVNSSHRIYRTPDETEFDPKDLCYGESRNSMEERYNSGEELPISEFAKWFEEEYDEYGETRYEQGDYLVRWVRNRHILVVWFQNGGLHGFRICNSG